MPENASAGGGTRFAKGKAAGELFHASPVAAALVSWRTGRYLEVNAELCDVMGLTREEIVGRTDLELRFWEHEERRAQFIADFRSQHRVRNMATAVRRRDGSERFVLVSAESVTVGGEECALFMATDITEYKRAAMEREQVEARLRQAQKLEAIGTLAGGIAHDFNNILAAILGYTELALDDVDEGTQLREDLEEVVRGAQRARELVKQMLTFSQRTETAHNAFGLQSVIREALKLLRSTLPVTIDIRSEFAGDPWIMGNAAQVLQVLMNLCTNAADAMSERGGVMEVVLSEVELGARPDATMPLAPGAYAVLSVSDTGCGIPRHLLGRIFEPFFTTKEKASGTGMGLSVAHGIVTKLGGDIRVTSEEGVGSTFEVLIPVAKGEEEPDEMETPLGNGESVLFVDDEEAITKLAEKMLGGLGYEVTSTTDSLEALAKCREDWGMFDIVITDLTMPGMTGEELAGELRKVAPNLPVILCTGHAEEVTMTHTLAVGIRGFLRKPFARKDLAQTVRRVLDETIVV